MLFPFFNLPFKQRRAVELESVKTKEPANNSGSDQETTETSDSDF